MKMKLLSLCGMENLVCRAGTVQQWLQVLHEGKRGPFWGLTWAQGQNFPFPEPQAGICTSCGVPNIPSPAFPALCGGENVLNFLQKLGKKGNLPAVTEPRLCLHI